MSRCLLLALFLVLAVLLLGGCARTGAEPGAPVTIRYSYWGAIYETKVWEELARRFNARQNRIRVKLEHIAGVAYHPKLLAMAVGRCAPDVMACDDEPFPELAENNIFEDLGPWMARDPSVKREKFYPTFFETWIHRGKSFAIPYDGHCLVMYYNKAHLRAAGLPEPPPDWTWNDFVRYARTLTRDLDGDGRIDRFGFVRPYNLYHSLPWVWSTGGREYDAGMTRCTLNTPEGVAGMRLCYDLVHKDHVTPRMTELPGMTPENMFLTGSVSLVIHGPWWLQMCRKNPALEWDVQHLPLGPKGRFTRTTCEALAMSAASTHKQEAWEWIRFVLSDEGQTVLSQFERGMPAVRAVAERVFPKPETPQHEERFLEAMEYSRAQRIPVQWGLNNTVITREWDLMLLGQRTPEEAARNIERDVNKIMAEPF